MIQAKPITALTKGVVISLILIVLSLVSFFMDLDPRSGFQYIGYAIFALGIIWSVIYYGKEVDHNATFGKYFSHGFSIAAIVTVIMVIFVVVFVWTNPSMKNDALQKASEQMQADKKLTEEQINKALDITKRFFTPMLIGMTLLGYIFFGTVFSLLGAAITKKNPRPVLDDEINSIG